MALIGFNLVLVGDNLPVERIRIRDFSYNYRSLDEKIRHPMMVVAETRGANLQILPNRVQATVIEVLDYDAAARQLIEMVQPIFDYVGPRLFTAVGHNAQFSLGKSGDRAKIYERLLQFSTSSQIMGGAVNAADVHLYSDSNDGAVLRAAFLSQSEYDSMVVDFNVNYDLTDNGDAKDSIGKLTQSLHQMHEVMERAEHQLLDGEGQSV